MTPYVGEAFVLKCAASDNAGDAYYLATVEEIRNGKVVAAQVVGPAIYRLGLEDEAVRFNSHRMRETLQKMINSRARQASVWFSRDAVMTDILEEIVMQKPTNDNGEAA